MLASGRRNKCESSGSRKPNTRSHWQSLVIPTRWKGTAQWLKVLSRRCFGLSMWWWAGEFWASACGLTDGWNLTQVAPLCPSGDATIFSNTNLDLFTIFFFLYLVNQLETADGSADSINMPMSTKHARRPLYLLKTLTLPAEWQLLDKISLRLGNNQCNDEISVFVFEKQTWKTSIRFYHRYCWAAITSIETYRNSGLISLTWWQH